MIPNVPVGADRYRGNIFNKITLLKSSTNSFNNNLFQGSHQINSFKKLIPF
jgi:hypothetical protein